MLPLSLQIRPARHRSGSAIVICLFLIVITSLLLVGYTTTTRNELASASSFLGGQDASLYAQLATNNARATIRGAIAGDHNYATAPGAIIRGANVSELHTPASTLPDTNLSFDFNSLGLLSGRGILAPSATGIPFHLSWIYVRRSGTMEIAGTSEPTYNVNDPLVGRYAFYTDDESARINLNTAYQRIGNTENISHPSHVNLRGVVPSIDDIEINAISSGRLSAGQLLPYPTTGSALKALPSGGGDRPLRNAIVNNPDAFTHYSHGSLRNIFGQDKIALTTQGSRAAGRPYLNILTDEETSPALFSNIDGGKLSTLFSTLYAEMEKDTWPILPGQSFVAKYGQRGTAQIILNIIDYVRSAEAQEGVVEPLRGTFNSTTNTFTLDASAQTADALVGNSRRPLISEVGFHINEQAAQADPNDANSPSVFQVTLYVKIFFPYLHALGDTTTPGIDLTTLTLRLHGLELEEDGGATTTPAAPSDYTIEETHLLGSNPPTTINGGAVGTVRWEFPVLAAGQTSPLQQRMKLRTRLSLLSGANELHAVPLDSSTLLELECTPSTTATPTDTKAPADPHVSNFAGDWLPTGTDSLSDPDSNVSGLDLAPTTNYQPPQDTVSGALTRISVSMPGTGGAVTSAGYLGYIHTGITPSAGTEGVPWRTLRFQPTPRSTPAHLPDWALLELFTTPYLNSTTGPSPAAPKGLEGQINLNTTLRPFPNVPARSIPLQALLFDAPRNSGGSRFTLSDLDVPLANISRKTLTTTLTPDYTPINPTYYLYPGEITEIADIADDGEGNEELIRQLLPLITTKSNVMRIYAIGQSIRQSNAGTISVLSEKRTSTLVEIDDQEVNILQQQSWAQ